MRGMDPALIEPLWAWLARHSAESLRMGDDEATRFLGNRVARLVGLLPFAAGCDEPGRTALAHLATFVVANRGAARAVFDHGPADDDAILARLAPIGDFRGGDAAVVAAGMARLGLAMLAGYRRDAAKDALTGEYNPINAGAWNAAAVEADLFAAATGDGSEILDPILAASEAIGFFWEV